MAIRGNDLHVLVRAGGAGCRKLPETDQVRAYRIADFRALVY